MVYITACSFCVCVCVCMHVLVRVGIFFLKVNKCTRNSYYLWTIKTTMKSSDSARTHRSIFTSFSANMSLNCLRLLGLSVPQGRGKVEFPGHQLLCDFSLGSY